MQEFGKNTDVLLRVQKQEGGNKEQIEALNKIKIFFVNVKSPIILRSTENKNRIKNRTKNETKSHLIIFAGVAGRVEVARVHRGGRSAAAARSLRTECAGASLRGTETSGIAI